MFTYKELNRFYRFEKYQRHKNQRNAQGDTIKPSIVSLMYELI